MAIRLEYNQHPGTKSTHTAQNRHGEVLSPVLSESLRPGLRDRAPPPRVSALLERPHQPSDISHAIIVRHCVPRHWCSVRYPPLELWPVALSPRTPNSTFSTSQPSASRPLLHEPALDPLFSTLDARNVLSSPLAVECNNDAASLIYVSRQFLDESVYIAFVSD